MPESTMERIAQEAMSLPNEERAELAERLLQSLAPDWEVAWSAEVARRISEVESGQVQPRSAKEVFAGLRTRFGG